MYHHYNTTDPANPYLQGPYPSQDSTREPKKDAYAGCCGSLIGIAITAIIFVLCCLFSSCATTKESSYVERHKVEDLVDRVDSLIRTKSVVQQDSSWRELILRQFQSIREKSDTSHTVVVDTAGRVIKETLVINNVREVNSESDRQEILGLTHRIEEMDSTMSLMRQQIQHSDSLLQSRQETVVRTVKNPLSLWQQARIWLGNLTLVALAVLAAIWAIRRRFIKGRILR